MDIAEVQENYKKLDMQKNEIVQNMREAGVNVEKE